MKSVNKNKKLVLALLLFAVLVLTPAAMAQEAQVSTDKGDYAPGETVYITGAGFEADEPVDISIAIMDDEGLFIPDVDWTIEFADADGAFQTEYIVPEEWAGKTLQLSAMGLESALVATVTFTDAAAANVNFATSGLPNGTSVSVNYSGTNNGNQPISGTSTFAAPGPSSNIGTLSGSSFTYSFPTSITVGSNTYNLVSTSPASPFATGAGAPAPPTTVTATYELYIPPAENHAPEITCLNPTAELGQAVGCLGVGTGFGQDFSVSYTVIAGTGNSKTVQATFTKPDSSTVTVDVATVTDADASDTITVTLANGTNPVTISGPGAGSADFSVDIHADDGSLATNATADETCGGTANAQIIYNFVGFLPPLNNAVSTKVKRGSTVPVKFQIFDCSGNPVTTGDHFISVTFSSANAPNGDATVDDAGSSGDNGIKFRYSDPNWIFNLKTNTSYSLDTTYMIWAVLDDETVHSVQISIKK
jgi:hypothetical protein